VKVPALVASLLALSAFPALAQAPATRPPAQQPPATQQAAPPDQKLPVVVLVATGGTIAMKYDPVKKGPVPAISGEDLVGTVPEIAKVARVEVQNVSNVPSDYMDPPRWVELANVVTTQLARPEVAGVVVSHGTDTLEETAWFLDLAVQSPKPVVLIGAQRNASERDFDGPRNLLNAARICVAPAARDKGVMLALNDQINAAREVHKTNTASVETFKSGELGFLGYADVDRVVFYRAPLRRQHVAVEPAKDGKPPVLPRVDVVSMYGGADGALLRAAVAAGARGVVVQALGYGNVNVPLYDAIAEVTKKGIPVVITSSVGTGRVQPWYAWKGGGKSLQEIGAVFGDDLPANKARILLMLALQTTSDPRELQRLFDR
jgi:L-asparaginase